MLAVIDAGNTNIVLAIYKDDAVEYTWRLTTDTDRTVDEYLSILYPLLRETNIVSKDVDDVIISSVVPDLNLTLESLCSKLFESVPVFVNSDLLKAYISKDAKKPSEIGADRLVNSVGVVSHYQFPAIILDFGTATTFDIVDEQGQYCGGVIAPGANLSMKALHQAAAKLPSVKIEKIDFVRGTDTIEAIQSGLYWGYVGMIEGVLTRLSEELNFEPFVIATGGLASLYADAVPAINDVDNELTLKGLRTIYLELQKNTNVTSLTGKS